MEFRTPRSAWAIASAACVSVIGAQPAAPVVDLDTAWFRPSLVVDESPVCDALLKEVGRHFAGTAPLQQLPNDGTFSIDGLRLDDANVYGDRTVVVGGNPVYVQRYRNPGCGGACETYGLRASDRPFPPQSSWQDSPPVGDATPASVGGAALYASQNDTYYAGVIAADVVQLLELEAPGTWKAACAVRIAPASLDAIDDAELEATLRMIESLLAATAAVAGGDGERCGSMGTQGRWAAARRSAMIETLYRPLQDINAGRYDSSYAALAPNLEVWSLTGIAENAAFAAYQAQLAATTEQLATFYTTHYGWALEQARPVAREALQGAVAAGMGFYEYRPFDSAVEGQLRAAIFKGEPIEVIRSIPIEAATIDGIEFTAFAGRETLLSSAVRHPAALQYLLERGGDPDRGNAFGKTPLMYAAQYNELEAARILLDHGADPNAATIRPYDRCTYPLSRTNVTALHYAARYAAPELIELLVERGAVTHVKVESVSYRAEDSEYPADWLRRYADPSSTEPNRYISAEALPRLERLLRVPSEAERATLAPQLVLEAEATYAAGDAEAAYRTLKSALQIDSDGPRALSDMSLIGLRAGQLGEALEAANKLIAANSEPRLLASAWFNQGLACEQSGRGMEGLIYNGRHYCQRSTIASFIEALKIEPTAGRRSKLDELFRGGKLRLCVRTQQDGTEQRFHFAIENTGRAGWQERIYAYHPVGTTIDMPAIGATALVEEHTLGASTVTVLIGPQLRRLDERYASCGASVN